jgi:flagellar biogenesis protein FliO
MNKHITAAKWAVRRVQDQSHCSKTNNILQDTGCQSQATKTVSLLTSVKKKTCFFTYFKEKVRALHKAKPGGLGLIIMQINNFFRANKFGRFIMRLSKKKLQPRWVQDRCGPGCPSKKF